jgi:hypothetical protein
MPAKTPQDHRAKDEGFTFTVGTKTYKLPELNESAADNIPGDITYAAVMEPENDMAQLRLAFASLEAAKPSDAAMKALRSLPTTQMLTVVGDWMGKAGGSSES